MSTNEPNQYRLNLARPRFIAWLICACIFTATNVFADSPGLIQYGKDIRPILAKACFTCHGPDADAREAGLRLDQAHDPDAIGAHGDLGGYQAINPGNVKESELFIRITSDDKELRMPPSESHKALKSREIELIRRWIEQDGRYTKHWTFEPPNATPTPAVRETSGVMRSDENPRSLTWVDGFLEAKIAEEGLQTNPLVDRRTRLRRTSLDLLGIVPTEGELRRYAKDRSPMADVRMVDRMLARPEYGERFATPWLDLARYSDTNGYEKDRGRTMWPYRDWVLNAMNTDKPFDEFSVEQLAGDMLAKDPDDPIGNRNRVIATGFHRNTMLNEEGGIDPMEYRFHAMVDRVATTGTVWLGLTTGCAQCHTHKYDPITHTDYYALFSLLNQSDEPELSVRTNDFEREQSKIATAIQREIQRLSETHLLNHSDAQHSSRESIPESKRETVEAMYVWLDELASDVRVWQKMVPTQLESTLPQLRVTDSHSVLASGDCGKRDVYELTFELQQEHVGATAIRLEVLPHESLPGRGPGMAFYEGRKGDFFLSELTGQLNDRPIVFADPSHTYGKISVGNGDAKAANVLDSEGSTGWSTSGAEHLEQHLIVQFADPVSATGRLKVKMVFERHFAAPLGHFRFSLTTDSRGAKAIDLPIKMQEQIASLQPATQDSAPNEQPPYFQQPELYKQLGRWFVAEHPVMEPHRKRLTALKRQQVDPPRTLVMRQRGKEGYRETHRHHRGEYLQPKETVAPAIPEVFGSLPAHGSPDRLDLARWLASSQNPLVGRVMVNRAWREFFGHGLVRTDGDYGTQSRPPTHPELLDTLAVDFMNSGWSLKRLHRQLVHTAAYQRRVGPAPADDPENLYLSCYPYRRLNAERIRDAFLSASKVLDRRVGGESVFPPQPESVWAMAYGAPKWKVSDGGDRYRRSLYTYAKRTAPFAAFTTFDGPTGEQCLAKRGNSTTPLQALTLMNDGLFLELADKFAESVLRDMKDDVTDREIVDSMFVRLLSRHPSALEVDAAVAFVADLAQNNTDNKDIGALSCWTLVARALMNLDESVCVP